MRHGIMSARYEIKGRIGREGAGAVYKAVDLRLKRDVAIKRLLPIEDTQLNEPVSSTLLQGEAILPQRLRPSNAESLPTPSSIPIHCTGNQKARPTDTSRRHEPLFVRKS